MNVLAYIRVSTGQQADSGLGLEAQRAAISTECSRRQWTIVRWYEDHESSRNARPELERALLDVRAPDVGAIIVAKLDRIGRSTHEVSGYIETAVKQDWQLVSLAPQVDMTTAYGRAMAQMACVFSELERAMIGERTSEALRAKIARGEWVGRRPAVDAAVEHRVRELRHLDGLGAQRIAEQLNREGWPTPGGRPWSKGTTRRILARLLRDDELGRAREAVA